MPFGSAMAARKAASVAAGLYAGGFTMFMLIPLGIVLGAEVPDLRGTVSGTLSRLASLSGTFTQAGTVDPVARFHLGNGARLERINFLGDVSRKGLRQSYGLMVNYLYDPLHPAVLRLMQFATEAALRLRMPVSVCGEMAGRPLEALALIGLGFTLGNWLGGRLAEQDGHKVIYNPYYELHGVDE